MSFLCSCFTEQVFDVTFLKNCDGGEGIYSITCLQDVLG